MIMLNGSWTVCSDAFTVAPYWDDLYLISESPASSVMAGEAVIGTNRYYVIQYENARPYSDSYRDDVTNAVSWQLVFPVGNISEMTIRYGDVVGCMDGRGASIGFQSFDGSRKCSYCYREAGAIQSGMALSLVVGGSDPSKADSDDDGLDDRQELLAGTNPNRMDSDSDGMPDKWELDHSLDPLDATGANGSVGDPDGDCLSNIDEYQNGCDPQDPDTDGDGVSDGVEVGQGSDPTDASDHGIAPPEEKFRELVFNINGDYAAWEMTIEGLGPDDTRTRKITMGAPNAAQNMPLKMHKGNSYRLSMRWLNCDGHADNQSPWYCWKAKIDGLPYSSTFQDYCIFKRELGRIQI